MTELICDLGECDHSPMRPPRNDHHGEQVFAERWAKLMTMTGRIDNDFISNAKLLEILRIRPEQLIQRTATIAATFVTWLGTNCGRAFIDEARKLSQAKVCKSAFVAQWAVENQRFSWSNSGFRAIEHILAPESDRANGQLKYRPELSADDYEVIESIVYWLGTNDGPMFLLECEREIKARSVMEDVAKAVNKRDFKHAQKLLESHIGGT